MEIKKSKITELISKSIDFIAPLKCIICQCVHTHSINSSVNICESCLTTLPLINEQHCQKCAIPLANDIDQICGSCLSSPPPWNSLAATVIYDTPIKEILTKAKFGKKHKYCSLIASVMLKELTNLELDSHTCFIPAPLHKQRLKERGYNQSLTICKELSKLTGVPVLDCLIKNNHTKPQSSLSKFGRLQSKLTFSINNKNLMEFKLNTPTTTNAIIVDDVMTTGTTIRQLSKTVKKIGFSTINVWVFARTC